MRAAVLLLALSGCDQLFNLDHLPPADPQSNVDAALGVIVDAPSSCPGGTFVGKNGAGGAGLLEVCVPSNVPATLDLPTTIDTSVAGQCDTIVVIDSYGTEACVKWAAVTRVTSVQATGPRVLVLVATTSLSVGGTVDVSSTHAGVKGAGGNWAGCPTNDGVSTATTGGSGGAGGSFSTRGGNGGSNGAGAYTGARTTALADRVRGGCNGGAGGNGVGTSAGGLGGRSGGAVYFIAGARLDLSATAVVNASGSGGKGGAQVLNNTYAGGGGGGGGGGSGGLIGLDAPLIAVDANAKLFANGGGAGGGGANTGAGAAGAEPSAATINTSATGGTGAATYGGAGGNGAATSGAGFAGGTSKAGGGGGGGLGYIVAFTTGPAVTTGKYSPPLSQ